MRPQRNAWLSIGKEISIHASLTGCDLRLWGTTPEPLHFNPRIPHGMRLQQGLCNGFYAQFQSTHPSRDATDGYFDVLKVQDILIHASLTGCDQASEEQFTVHLLFQSTHPSRDATILDVDFVVNKRISIHASLTGCDAPDEIFGRTG